MAHSGPVAKLVFDGKTIPVTVSIGVATWAVEDTQVAEELIRLADENLYRAKRSGRNRTESAAMG